VDEGNPDSGHTVIPCDEFNADDDEDGGPDACADPVTGEPTPDPPDDWLNPPPDGQLRVVDSPDGDSVAVVDMGYDEVVPRDCPWDCQAEPNGQVDVADFLHLLDEWGQECPTADCDQVGPSGVGTEDFLALLPHWGPCTEQASVSGGSDSAYDPQELALQLMGFDGIEEYGAWLEQATDDEAFASLVVFAALLVQP
jgi:hypothetical protein